MEIVDIKQNLSILEVLKHYSLQPDPSTSSGRANLICCPFHKDKTPSLQLYPKTNTYNCFGCGKTGDVIQFIQDYEKTDKHSAIMKAKTLINPHTPSNNIVKKQSKNTATSKPDELPRIAILTKAFNYFVQGAKSYKLRDYLKSRNLDPLKIEIGYNSGQFHHRQSMELVNSYAKYNLLLPGKSVSNEGKGFIPWAKHCIIFALRDKQDHVTSLYGRSTLSEKVKEDSEKLMKHFYLKDRSGLYPRYPNATTERLILTEAIIDAATLLQIEAITSDYSVLACYGTNGLSEEHKAAIQVLRQLKEIIFAFDADEAGRVATIKYAKELSLFFPEVKISTLELPEGEDVNSLLMGHDDGIFTDLLNKRVFLFSIEDKNKTSETSVKPKDAGVVEKMILQEEKNTPNEIVVKTGDTGEAKKNANPATGNFNTANPYKLRFTTETANYYVQGGISRILDSMKITIVIEHLQTQQKARNKVDLYEDKQIEKLCKDVSEKLNLRKDLLEADIYKLTDLLEEYREKQQFENLKMNESENGQFSGYSLTQQEREKVEIFLKQEKLVYRFNELLGKSGIAGEKINRIFLLIIAISYKMPEPLHALIQGSSGSGKTRLLRQISDCMPPERVIRLTRVSDKGFYNYPEKYLRNKLLSLEDVDGLGEEATFAFRELQSNGELNSATSVKLENGQIVSGQKSVKGPIASLACTTQGEIYEDNMSRVFLIAVDESPEQTKRIIQYQNNKAAGEIDGRKEQDIKRFIQNTVREMSPYEVVNPYANQIQLPEEAHKIRRLNELFQSFVKMITVINQYQRRKDKKGRLITETEDIETGIDIMFESIVLKVDELDGSLRQFYEKLKSYVTKKGRNFEFSRFDVREATGLGKTQQHHYMNKLLELEYLQQYGFANRGFKYKVVHWDNYCAIREKIKRHLQEQLEQLKIRISEQQVNKNTLERTPANAN